MGFVGVIALGSPLVTARLISSPRILSPWAITKTYGRARSLTMQAGEGGGPEEPAVEEAETEVVGSATRPTVPAGFETPEPKRFYVRPDNLVNVALGGVAAAVRLGSGALVSGYKVSRENGSFNERSTSLPETRPNQPLQVFEFEACPFCRKVREALCMLDLDVYVYPTPKSGVRFRPQVIEMGGKAQFPYIIDPNTGFQGYESDDIVSYLYKTYGDGSVPLTLTPNGFTTLSSGLASLARGTQKGNSRESKTVFPELPLDMWGYETSPFCKIVREKLCELELPYLLHNTARGSKNRKVLADLVDGPFQVPYIEDPNTGVKMFESLEIVEYLDMTYGASAHGASADLPEALKGEIPTTVDVQSV